MSKSLSYCKNVFILLPLDLDIIKSILQQPNLLSLTLKLIHCVLSNNLFLWHQILFHIIRFDKDKQSIL